MTDSWQQRALKCPADLSELWAEYDETGAEGLIRRVIDVLDRPDVLGQQLREWVSPQQMPGWLKALASIRLFGLMEVLVVQGIYGIVRSSRARALRKRDGIEVNLRSGAVVGSDDIDLKLALAGDAIRFDAKELRSRYGLDGDQADMVLLKANAFCALARRCQSEGQVRAVCTAEVERRRGRSQTALQRILANAATATTAA